MYVYIFIYDCVFFLIIIFGEKKIYTIKLSILNIHLLSRFIFLFFFFGNRIKLNIIILQHKTYLLITYLLYSIKTI